MRRNSFTQSGINSRALAAIAAAAALVALVGELGSPPHANADAPGTCFGAAATIVVGTADRTTNGTSGNDVIIGSFGVDVINGGGGSDRICSGSGGDTVRGGAGDDKIDGGLDNDTLYGDAGFDVMKGGAGDDTLRGGTEDDTLSGGTSNDAIFGDGGIDTVDYTQSLVPVNVHLELSLDGRLISYGTGEGSDTFASIESVAGSRFGDTIEGSSGPNAIFGGGGDDTISGSGRAVGRPRASGQDYLHGGDGRDRVECTDTPSCMAIGGGGDDIMDIYTSSTYVFGDVGADVITVNSDSRVQVDGGRDADRIRCDTACTAWGGDGDDILTGAYAGGDDEFHGGNGMDRIQGGAGHDTMFGDADDDNLNGEAGIDSADGGAGEYDWCTAEGPQPPLNCENRIKIAPITIPLQPINP